MKGLEPPRLTAQDPKSCAATNYATSACEMWRKDTTFYFPENKIEMENGQGRRSNLNKFVPSAAKSDSFGMFKTRLPFRVRVCHHKFITSCMIMVRRFFSDSALPENRSRIYHIGASL